jgi:mono/diheme cytochrome c family protein
MMRPIPALSLACLTASLLLGGASLLAQQAPAAVAAPLAAPTGDATRGKTLFDQTLRCYACHGFDGQTGSPRLVPMARAQEVFLAYVRKPATQGMPSFRDAAERDLIDVYAYIRSIPVAAPSADSIPLLKSIVDRRTAAK